MSQVPSGNLGPFICLGLTTVMGEDHKFCALSGLVLLALLLKQNWAGVHEMWAWVVLGELNKNLLCGT